MLDSSTILNAKAFSDERSTILYCSIVGQCQFRLFLHTVQIVAAHAYPLCRRPQLCPATPVGHTVSLFILSACRAWGLVDREIDGEDLNRVKKRKTDDSASQMQRQWLWVSEDEPEKSKDKQKLKNIRSHVMFDHLSEKRKSMLWEPTSSPPDGTLAYQWQQDHALTGVSRRDSGLPSPTSMPLDSQAISGHVDRGYGPSVIFDYHTPRSMSTPEPQQVSLQSSPSAPSTSKRDDKKPKHSTEDGKRRHTESDATKVVKFVDHEQPSIFALSYTSIQDSKYFGGNKACFEALPQLQNPSVSVAELKRQCGSAYIITTTQNANQAFRHSLLWYTRLAN